MDRLDAMHAFVTVADVKGFATAARKLGRSTSNVTRLIAGLEASLGIRLLQRTTRSVTLTDAGDRYLRSIRDVVAGADEAERIARAQIIEASGRLTIAAPSAFGRREVAPVVSALLEKHPSLCVELLLADRVMNLVEEGIDVAVRIGTLDDSSLRVRTVGHTRRVLVASPGYLEKRRAPRRPAELASHAIIRFIPIAPANEWRFVSRGGEQRVSLTPVLSTNDVDVAIGHALRSGGVTAALSYQVANELRSGRLVEVLRGFALPPVPIQVVYPTGRLMPASLKAFIELAVSRRGWEFA